MRSQHAIVKHMDESGDLVISASKLAHKEAIHGKLPAIDVVIGNPDVRNCGVPGVNLQRAMQCRPDNIFVNPGVHDVRA